MNPNHAQQSIVSRRRFMLHAAAVGAVGWCAPRVAIGNPQDSLPIIDTHQHLWDLKRFKPPWLKGAAEVIAKPHVTADFIRETRGLNVVKAIYMEVDVAPHQQVEEAQHVIELSASDEHPTVAGVISGRPNDDDFENYIRQFQNSPAIKGVRQVLQVPSTPRGHCLQPRFVKSIQLLGELGMSFDLCMRPSELADGAQLAKQCPGTRFIVDHCGNADPKAFQNPEQQGSQPWHEVGQWKRDMATLAERDNVVCKISGIVARAPKGWEPDDLAPIINHCLDQFGPNRVMFGGDWPVCKLGASYRQWVNGFKVVIADRPITQQKRLLHDNAVAFYNV